MFVSIYLSEAKFNIQDTRLLPNQDISNLQQLQLQLKTGDECEVLTESKEDEPSGWWPATVKMQKGEFYVVDYKIQDENKYSDIIPSDRIRVPNKSPPVSLSQFHKCVFQVPEELHEM